MLHNRAEIIKKQKRQIEFDWNILNWIQLIFLLKPIFLSQTFRRNKQFQSWTPYFLSSIDFIVVFFYWIQLNQNILVKNLSTNFVCATIWTNIQFRFFTDDLHSSKYKKKTSQELESISWKRKFIWASILCWHHHRNCSFENLKPKETIEIPNSNWN